MRTLLIVPFMLQIFVAVGLTGAIAFFNGQKAVNDLAGQLRNEVTARIQERLQAYLSIPHKVNELNSNALSLKEIDLHNAEEDSRHFYQQVKTFKLISHSYVATPAGGYFGAKRLSDDSYQVMRRVNGDNLYFSVDAQGFPVSQVKIAKNYDPRLRPWYQAAVQKQQATWSAVYPDFTTNSLAITAASPLYQDNKNLKAVLGASFILSWMDDFLSSLRIGKTGQTFIMDRNGLLIASSSHAPVLKKQTDKSQSVRIPANESSNARIRHATQAVQQYFGDLSHISTSQSLDFVLNNDKQFLQITPLRDRHGLDWLILVIVPESDFMERINMISVATFWLSVVALVLGLLGGLLTSHWVIRPIQHLNNAAKSLALGRWDQVVEARRKDELGELARSFNSMAEQLKESFATLETKNADLRKLDTLKDEFLANTSHELRTPLNGIVGIAESMCDGAVGSISESQRKNLLMVAQSGHRLTNLVNDILDFSKLKHKNINLQLKSVGMREVVEVVLMFSQTLVGQKAVKLINHIPQNLPPVLADENRLQQILHNLVGNAIKFTESGKIEIFAEYQTTAKPPRLLIRIRDTGIGISAEKLGQIFDSFEQVDGSNARQYGGTGLGLTVTKQLVELHQGQITVTSQPNQGSEFSFTLPVVEDEKTPTADLSNISPHMSTRMPLHETQIKTASVPDANEQIQQAGAKSSHQKSLIHPNPDQFTILIVDDEPINLQVLVNHLSLQNYAVVEANDGLEALQLVEEGLKPHLVLLDIMMPRMTGYEVCRRLREYFPANELPILLLTAKTQVSNLIEGLDAGANDYLTKPVSKNELLARIKTHLQLSNLNIAYGRFVPHEFIQLMDKQSVVDVKLGDHIERNMTILFSDIRGFTTISEAMTPQENFDFINAYLSRMEPIISKYEGFIDKYIGDAIMALFPGSVDSAVQAGVDMLIRLVEYNTSRGRPGRPNLKIGIGIHFGSLMLGTVGGKNRMDGTVIADAVNLASRTEGLTKSYGTALLITEQTYQNMRHPEQFLTRMVDRVRVKGKTEAVTVYEVFDADEAKERQLKLKTLDIFSEGFHHYHDMRITAAQACFQQVLEQNPQDSVVEVYLQRCQQVLEGELEIVEEPQTKEF
ncbi:ATP-binding protein [Candidatus Venteria ishoeyi]|uniref:ATP-binding protein n=1 Tax=Candidatus Venteria ishoeyi TaxID=1899563 RepID=UPI00255C64D0|nr:ATP-binding protein [Candidatus Venteria ishoeyi]